MKTLFTPIRLGGLELKNRIFMAPLTRSRALGNVPSELTPLYYTQRASAGLIIAEATQISTQGIGYINTPGIHTKEQIEAWKRVTKSVHEKDGKIFLQLWHVGRVSHPDFHGGKLPVSSSAIGFPGESFTPEGRKPLVVPRALEIGEIKEIIEHYGQAARNADEAGFDGVEIHAANGYLPEQFLVDSINQRTDQYGGSIANRSRFVIEATDAAISAIGASRVGVRISPNNRFNSLGDSNAPATYGYVTSAFAERKLAYLHVVEGLDIGRFSPKEGQKRLLPHLREIFDGPLVANGGYTQKFAEDALHSGLADAVSFGVLFIANPDLPERFLLNAPLNVPDPTTFYTPGPKGYIDYLPLQSSGG